MGKLLYIQASPRGARSVSTAVADAFVAAYRKAHPADEVKTVNLFTADLPPFDGFALDAKYAILNGQNGRGRASAGGARRDGQSAQRRGRTGRPDGG